MSTRVSVVIILMITIFMITLFRCDMSAQCPSGEDEEGCTIPESARHIMSLFFIIINVFLIVWLFPHVTFMFNMYFVSFGLIL